MDLSSSPSNLSISVPPSLIVSTIQSSLTHEFPKPVKRWVHCEDISNAIKSVCMLRDSSTSRSLLTYVYGAQNRGRSPKQ
eukprot:scaffold201649_cov24-Attheya_sp.AAC.1